MAAEALPMSASEAELTPSELAFPVVGIGASAGGLAALLRFFEQTPAAPGMAFVVILHLSPKHASNVHQVLQGATRMPVTQVHETTHIEVDHVYVIPPTRELTMNDGVLAVAELRARRGGPVAIDLFFRSLAVVHRARAVAVVLSGTGSDGAVGITRIKEQGGLTFAQTPADAEFDGMPRAAIATQAIDWVLPVAEIPQKLIDLWANARNIELPASEITADEPQVDPPPDAQARREAEIALRDIMTTLRTRTGHDFRHYKRATVLRRLERRLQVNGLPNLPAYRDRLNAEAAEAQALLKDLLIGVTNFFRDREAFEVLEREVVPALFGAGTDAAPPETLRVWVPGCATGEEAYSVAILLLEEAQRRPNAPDVQVFASDIDEQAIATARTGLYPESIVTDVTPTRLRQFFVKEGSHYRVRGELRERLLFAVQNVLRDPPFSKLDLICCRNLLIYLDRHVHAGLLEMLHFALRPGGFLFLGSAESAEAASSLFTAVDKKHRIYRAVGAPRTNRGLPALPGSASERDAMPPLAQPTNADRRKASYAELHRQLAEQHAPPSVLIDADGEIVHLSDRAGRFLRHAGGAPSHHLVTLVRPELRLELRTALYQAMRSGKSVEARTVPVERDGRRWFVNMVARPVPDTRAEVGPLVLVLFDEVEETLVGEGGADAAQRHDPVVEQLEQELTGAREQLQHTIEQSETSHEELRAANEELQSMNEELRSTSEELETSKEELQSINEELMTVNNELKSKVEESGRLNDDLQNLIAATDVATVFIDRGLRIKRHTPRATELFNLIASDVGRPLLDIVHRLDYAGLAGDAAEVFRTLHPIEREIASHDGRWFLARLVPYRTVEDRIDGAVLSFLDISARRRAEERSRIEEARLRLVADSTDYAIVTFDVAERITGWNRGAERLFGYAPSEVLGEQRSLLFTPEDLEHRVAELELRSVRESGRAAYDRWHLRRDGGRVFVSGILTALIVDGVLHGYAKIAHDATAERRRTAEREELLSKETAGRAEAQAVGELKDEFLAVMSHELRNPLNLIQLNAELLSKLPETRDIPAVQRAAGIIRRTVTSQAKIIDDLLDLSRINTGKMALHLGSVDWSASLAGIVGAFAGDAAKKPLRLDVQMPEAPVIVHADPVRVEQIVWNLLSNAMKFTPAGGAVSARLVQQDDFGLLEVRDTGRGIAPQFLPKVFDMFQQAQPKGGRESGGLGIGLALVRHLVQMHGGRVAVESAGEGRGSTFSVWLPRQDVIQLQGPSRTGAEELLRGKRVLVVDDEPHSIETLQELLTIEGLLVATAADGAQALAATDHGRFDVVISDISMPGMDGYELLRALRARGHATPAVALTGYGRNADMRRALDAGFGAHLAKPVTLDRLVATLVEVLAER